MYELFDTSAAKGQFPAFHISRTANLRHLSTVSFLFLYMFLQNNFYNWERIWRLILQLQYPIRLVGQCPFVDQQQAMEVTWNARKYCRRYEILDIRSLFLWANFSPKLRTKNSILTMYFFSEQRLFIFSNRLILRPVRESSQPFTFQEPQIYVI